MTLVGTSFLATPQVPEPRPWPPFLAIPVPGTVSTQEMIDGQLGQHLS